KILLLQALHSLEALRVAEECPRLFERQDVAIEVLDDRLSVGLCDLVERLQRFRVLLAKLEEGLAPLDFPCIDGDLGRKHPAHDCGRDFGHDDAPVSRRGVFDSCTVGSRKVEVMLMRRGGRGAAAATHQLCSQLQEQQRSSFWTTLRLALDPTPRGYAKTAGMRVARQSSEGCPPVLESHTAPGSQAPLPRLYLSVTAPLTVVALLAALLLAVHQENYADLHTLLDTSDFLLSGMLALLFWTAAQRLQQSILRMLAVSFMAASVLELLHALAGIEWTGPLQPLTHARGILRPATWLPAAYVLPSGISALLWRANKHPRPKIFRLAVTLLLAGASMIAVFYWLDLTRPALIPVPLLWSAIAAAFWRRRHEDRLYPMLSLTAAVLV